MTRRTSIIRVSAPVSIAIVMLALGAILLAQGQTPPTRPGVQTPGAAAPAPATAGASDATAKITGQVLAADTSLPVKRAIVRARGGTPQPPAASAASAPGQPVAQLSMTFSGSSGSTVPPGMAQREVTTDDTGRFEMLDLPAGRYSVNVQAPATFVSPPSQSAQVAAGGSATVNFRLDRGGAITGRVLDHEGDPLVRAQVSALQRRNLGGAARLMSAGSGGFASTDDLGQYRLFGLPPGEYYVAASYSTPGPMLEPTPSDNQPKYGYSPTFYPSAIGIDGAQKVTVRAGQDTSGVDVALVRAKLGSVSGRATDAAGNPITGSRGYVSLVPAGELTTMMSSGGTRRREDGSFVISNVPPGRYMLIATAGTGVVQPGGTREGAFKPVTIDGDDIVMDIQTNTGATVSGRIVIEGSAPAPTPSTSGSMAGVRARVSTRPAELGSTMSSAASYGTGVNVGDDLAFQLTGLRGALAVAATGPRMTLKSVIYAGDDIMLKGLDLAGTEKIEGVTITLTTDVAIIDGMVTTAAGDPGDAWVLVFSEDASKWVPGSPFVRTTRTRPSPATMASGRGATAPGVQPTSAYANRQGGFVMNGLLPGRYHVSALPYSSDPNSPAGVVPATDRDSLEKLRANAKTVRAAVGQASSVELRLPK
jgi:hypothetical protein